MVVPTYNERDNIGPLLERIEGALRGLDFEVVVVDDDSPDGTWRLAEELARTKYPWLRVVRRVGERGLASAVVEGFRLARGRFVAVMDADLQHPPEVLPRLLDAARRGADVVVASRYAPGGGVRGWSKLRLLMSRVATLLAHMLVPESKLTSDPLSGFFLVRRDVVSSCIARLRPRGYKILLEILARCGPVRVAEVAYTFERRARGESKLGASTVLSYLLQLLELNEYRVLKMAAVGALGVVVLYVVHVLLGLLGLPRLISYAAAIEASILHNFALNNAWTFRGRRGAGLARRLAAYHTAVAAGAAVNYTVYQLLAHLDVPDPAAVLTGVAAGYLANYLLAEHRVWGLAPTYRRVSPGASGTPRGQRGGEVQGAG